MSDENYRKCKTCRFCIHSNDIWVCSISDRRTQAEATCERYRPGSCENCSNLKVSKESVICGLTKEETDTLSVCSDYDPNGRRSV